MRDRPTQPRHCGISHQSLVDEAYRRGYGDGARAEGGKPCASWAGLWRFLRRWWRRPPRDEFGPKA